jgi:hypothetical protein
MSARRQIVLSAPLAGQDVGVAGRFGHFGGLIRWARYFFEDRGGRFFDGGEGFSPGTVVIEVWNALLRESRV